MPTFPPFPHFNLHDPCAADANNVIKNGSMGPEHHDTPFGTVVDHWEPFVLGARAPHFNWVDNEGVDPGGSQQIFLDDLFDAGVMQTVKRLQPNMVYMFRLGYSLAAKSINGPNVRVQTIGRKIGVDVTGGKDPKSPNVIWGPDLFDGKAALNRPEMQMVFVAQSNKATIFLRAMVKQGPPNDPPGENRVWFDAICMEPRPDISPNDVSQPPVIEQTLAQAAQARADAAKPWMPVNNGAALWNFAQANNLQDQQTGELEFIWKGEKYLVQVFNLGIVYCKVGDFGNIQLIRK